MECSGTVKHFWYYRDIMNFKCISLVYLFKIYLILCYSNSLTRKFILYDLKYQVTGLIWCSKLFLFNKSNNNIQISIWAFWLAVWCWMKKQLAWSDGRNARNGREHPAAAIVASYHWMFSTGAFYTATKKPHKGRVCLVWATPPVWENHCTKTAT